MFRRIVPAMVAAVLVWRAMAADRIAQPDPRARDLAPVTWLDAPAHPPVEIVREGEARAVIHVAESAPSATLRRLVDELVEVIRLITGAALQRAAEMPPADRPAIVIGDCDETRRAGIDAAKLPVEGFVVKTAPHRVYLVGSTAALPAGSTKWAQWSNEGTAWAVADFLERFAGVRWYWPTELGGRSIAALRSLAVPPVHYSDQPVFRLREFHPAYGWKLPQKARWFDKEPLPFAPGAIPEGINEIPMAGYLPLVRAGSSWPYRVKVHEPQRLWRRGQEWLEANKEMFAVKKDGTRNFSMLCYSSPRTLEYLLKGCEEYWDGRDYPDVYPSWVTATCVTVSPADYAYECHCPDCRQATEQGGAAKLVAMFVRRMCEAVKKRWPDKKVMYLPYWNYQKCPADVDFPDNLVVKVCTTGGPMALMRQAHARRGTEENIRAWSIKARGPVTVWDYSDRGSGWTFAPFQYPHLVCDFYRKNREHIAGVFINGGGLSDWTTTAPTMYVWMKALWNPDIDADAVLDAMCARLFGRAGDTVRRLIRLQCQRWQDGRWKHNLADAGRIPPELYREIWPAEVVAEMKALRDRALAETADDAAARQRLLFWTWTFDAFLKEAAEVYGGAP